MFLLMVGFFEKMLQISSKNIICSEVAIYGGLCVISKLGIDTGHQFFHSCCIFSLSVSIFFIKLYCPFFIIYFSIKNYFFPSFLIRCLLVFVFIPFYLIFFFNLAHLLFRSCRLIRRFFADKFEIKGETSHIDVQIFPSCRLSPLLLGGYLMPSCMCRKRNFRRRNSEKYSAVCTRVQYKGKWGWGSWTTSGRGGRVGGHLPT